MTDRWKFFSYNNHTKAVGQIKELLSKGRFRNGPRGPGPPFGALSNISASHVQYGIPTFAEFKCPGCTFKIASQRTSLNLKNFPAGACAQNSLEPCTVRIPDGHYCTHIAIVYYISIPPLSQNPPSDAVIPTTPATNQLIIYLKYIV